MKKISKETNFDYLQNNIVFNGIRTHNLKNIDITLPKNKIITVTGVSGSGKSSLAFDTIYKEGQFRYIESLSSYLRQFFNLGERPDIDYCHGLSPAIAIEQNKKAGNSRSSVGTLTEIDDYIRLLYSKLGNIYCYGCGEEIKPQTIEQIIELLKETYYGNKVYLLKEIKEIKDKAELTEFVKKNRNKVEKGKGFTRYLLIKNIDKTKAEKVKKTESESLSYDPIEYFYLEEPNVPASFFPLSIYGIFDRVTIEDNKLPRLKEDIIKILQEVPKFGIYTDGIKDEDEKPTKGKAKAKATELKKIGGQIAWFTDKMYCADCNITYPEFTPQHFSGNRQEGACPTCHGIGEVLQVDFEKIIDPESTYMNAILPRRDSMYGQMILKKLAEKYSMAEDRVWKELPARFLQVVLEGDGELIRIHSGGKYTSMYYRGIEEIIKDQYLKGLLTVDFQAMINMKTCPDCNGAKLRRESLNVFLETSLGTGKKAVHKKHNISELHRMPIRDLMEFLDTYQQTSTKNKNLLDRICTPLLDRTRTIHDLGLRYLSLNRTIDTLSGGEIQRIRLGKQLGNKLTGIVYVLDEPTIGLDEREIKRAIAAITKLKDMGNTIIVVEHNEEFIKASDRVVEIGPGAGDFGGNLMFNGTYTDFLKSNTLTAQYITGKKKVAIDFSHNPSNKFIKIKKASKYNLQNIDVKIRLGSFTIITGPSGAGKTTLMYTTLFKFLNEKEKFIQSYIRLHLLKKGWTWQQIISAPVMNKDAYSGYENMALQEFYQELGVETIMGYDDIRNVIYVDQTSIGKTPRSCPATFIGTFDHIRNIFAGANEAKYLGFTSGYFSFNSEKGACSACQGYGYKKVELQFLPDTYVPCDLCKGKRYKPEVLDIKWKGKNIVEILEMYVSDALELFKDIGFIKDELQLMCNIGLGYLRMGQPAHTLSGGESQRLKLVKHLLKEYKGHTIYFLDEPTVGLHAQDIEKLLRVIKEFLDKGDTILMIEHDKNLLQYSDDIIRLEDGALVETK